MHVCVRLTYHCHCHFLVLVLCKNILSCPMSKSQSRDLHSVAQKDVHRSNAFRRVSKISSRKEKDKSQGVHFSKCAPMPGTLATRSPSFPIENKLTLHKRKKNTKRKRPVTVVDMARSLPSWRLKTFQSRASAAPPSAHEQGRARRPLLSPIVRCRRWSR